MKKLFYFSIFIFFLFVSVLHADTINSAVSLEEAFIDVSKKVGPSVVSISVEHIEKYQTVYQPFSRSRDSFFNDFFNDFFVMGPEREYRKQGLGSGVIIDEEGYILTNEHVVGGASIIKVTLPDGREFDAELKGSDVYTDLAVIKIDPKNEKIPYAKLGDSDEVKIGQWAIAIGNPFAFAVKNPEPTVTVGIISALNRNLPRTDRRIREYDNLIQTDAAINPGNSGGPLINIHGEVIGINVAIFTLSGGSEGIGFAIPINTAKKIMDNLIEGKKVLYGWIGVVIQDMNKELLDYFSLKKKGGIFLSQVVKNSPADKAGLKPGDIITRFDDKDIKDTNDIIKYVLRKNIGDVVKVDFIRDKKERAAKVKIGVKPGVE